MKIIRFYGKTYRQTVKAEYWADCKFEVKNHVTGAWRAVDDNDCIWLYDEEASR